MTTFQSITGLDRGDGEDYLYSFGGNDGGNAFANPLKGLPGALDGMRPPSQGGLWAGQTGVWQQAPGSALGPRTADLRPLSSHRPANYQSQMQFDPMKQGTAMGPAPPLQKKSFDSPEEQCLEMERKVNALIEESAQLSLQKDYPLALEKAKEASKKERMLCKHREVQGLGDQINIDLTYSVHFNLAVQYQKNQLYTEALNTYNLIVRNKQYAQSGRLRVNMGNIYYEQGKYTLAIKMYRLAMDQIPNTGKDLKYRIVRNIANAYVKIGQYQDAIGSYETIMEGTNPDLQTGFNLLLCYYALGDKDRLKRHFTKLLHIRKYGATDDDDLDEVMDEVDKENELIHADDHLRAEIRERRSQHMEIMLTAARLIAPMIEKDWLQGFDHIIEQLRHYELKDATSRIASEMEMCKALNFLKHKKYAKAIEALKAFEKKDKTLKAKAATNLSYLYFLEGDIENGQKYADLSITSDKFNAKALVNKGNFCYVKNEYEKAKAMYLESLAVEADCFEAMYNLGLATKNLRQYEEALHVFKKLQSMIPDSTEVTYHIANLYELMGDVHSSGEWFNRLVSRVPTDPNVLARLGAIYAKEGDESQAFHYHLEAYRYFPVNMEVISWLGAYFVKNEVYEKAMQFFERAAQIQPNEVRWQLMVASCHRRIGSYPQAKALYEEIHKKYPDNTECLRYLVHICNDSGMKDEAVDFHKKLKRLEARLHSDDSFFATGNADRDENELQNDNTDPTARMFLASDEQSRQKKEPLVPPLVGKVVGSSAARINKRQVEQEKEMQAMAKAKDVDDNYDLDVDEMLPGM